MNLLEQLDNSLVRLSKIRKEYGVITVIETVGFIDTSKAYGIKFKINNDYISCEITIDNKSHTLCNTDNCDKVNANLKELYNWLHTVGNYSVGAIVRLVIETIKDIDGKISYLNESYELFVVKFNVDVKVDFNFDTYEYDIKFVDHDKKKD